MGSSTMIPGLRNQTQTALPLTAVGHTRNQDVDPDVFSLLFAIPFLNDSHTTHLRRPISQRANACGAVVLPEFFGPMKTTILPSSISTSSSRFEVLNLEVGEHLRRS
jgi:hypothetical protein